MGRLWLCKVGGAYGAPMGRVEHLPSDRSVAIKLQLQRLRFVDGCYDSGGAYWGAPTNVWLARGEVEEDPDCIELYCRAWDREEAKEIIRERLPNARFYR